MGSTRDYRMVTTDALLRHGLQPGRAGLELTLDPAFAGLPGAAHGGTALAAFDLVAGLDGPRRVAALYRRRVPLATALHLATSPDGSGMQCGLYQSGTLLVEGRVDPGDLSDDACGSPFAEGTPLPISTTCFVCGVENAAGLRAALRFDEAAVFGAWTPDERFRAPDGSLSSVAVTALLDEAAFWLGALATGESGMTTDLAVTLAASAPLGSPLTVRGDRTRVRPAGEDRRYWQTHVTACDGAGRPLAAADITFVAVRGAARKLAAWVAPLNPPDVLHRVFPAYA
jgi:acyl-coenzyme A thioesterase PaaI-like protein